MKAMVLAAGRGERMRPLTDELPKPLLEVGGKPLIVHHLEALARAGVHEAVVNLSWLGERIRAALGPRCAGVRITYSEEGPVPLETGGGIFRALPWLGSEPFLVVNGDVWTDFDFARLISRAVGPDALDAANAPDSASAEALACIVLVPNPPHHPRGDFGFDGARVNESEADRHTYSGIGLYRPEFFAGCEPGRFPLLPLLRRAIAAGKLHGLVHRGRWHDIGTPERLAALDVELRAGGVESQPCRS